MKEYRNKYNYKRVIFFIYFGYFFSVCLKYKTFSSLGRLLRKTLARCDNHYRSLGCFSRSTCAQSQHPSVERHCPGGKPLRGLPSASRTARLDSYLIHKLVEAKRLQRGRSDGLAAASSRNMKGPPFGAIPPEAQFLIRFY
jgi:hypothetical protein